MFVGLEAERLEQARSSTDATARTARAYESSPLAPDTISA